MIFHIRRIALLAAAMFYVFSAAEEADAACSYKSLEKLPSLTKSGYMPMTVAFAHSDLSDAGNAISRFETGMQSINPRIIGIAGEVKALTFDEETDVEQIYRQETGMLAVVDSQFMKTGKPKYNSLLLSFRDTTIEEDQILILDPWPIAENLPDSKPDRVFIQVTSTIEPEVLPYLLELAAYLWYEPKLFSTPEFASYASLVTNEAADGGFLSPSTLEMRKAVVVNCLDARL